MSQAHALTQRHRTTKTKSRNKACSYKICSAYSCEHYIFGVPAAVFERRLWDARATGKQPLSEIWTNTEFVAAATIKRALQIRYLVFPPLIASVALATIARTLAQIDIWSRSWFIVAIPPPFAIPLPLACFVARNARNNSSERSKGQITPQQRIFQNPYRGLPFVTSPSANRSFN